MPLRPLSVLLYLLLSACVKTETVGAEERELVVFAASSLRDAFTQLRLPFEAAHPGAAVSFNFAGSQELRAQLESGARADVVAMADEQMLSALLSAGRVRAPALFARNEPVIVLTPDAAARVQSFEALPNAERFVLGLPEVPIGRYSQQILERAGEPFRSAVEKRVVSREPNVRQILAKVRLGEADAAFVYRTDARTAPELKTLQIPPSLNVTARYPVAVVADSPHPTLAEAWSAFLLSSEAQRRLSQAGFLPAPGEH